jgi:hypothetical protein
MGYLETLIGKEHFDYKTYREKLNVVIEAIDEIAFLSNTLDYERLIVFFKEVVETFDYYKNIDENDDNSEGFSNMDNKEQLLLNIIDCDEYNNLINFLETYRTTIIRKCDKLLDKIIELKEFKSQADRDSDASDGSEVKKNPYIDKDYAGNVELMSSKMKGIASKLLDNIESKVPLIDEKKLKFDIKIITKNDIICILSLYRSLKNFVYKQMHVLDREYYTATKEDVLAFRKELYKLYELICDYFNKNKNTYLEDIREKFEEVLVSLEGGTVKAAKAVEVVKADDAVKAAEGTEADIAKAAEEEELKKLEKKMNVDNTENTEELDDREKLIADNKGLLQNRTAGTRAAPEAPEAQLKEDLEELNIPHPSPKRPVVEEPINRRQLAEENNRKALLNNSLSPTPQPPPKTPVDEATDAIKTQLEAQGKAAANAAQAKAEAELKAKAEQLTAVKAEAEAKLKGAKDAVAGAQAKAEAELKAKAEQLTAVKEQAEAKLKGVQAKVNEAKDKFLSFKGLQTSAKGANGEAVSPSGMFSQLAQSALKIPSK